MKRIIALFLAVAMIFAFAACAKSVTQESTTQSDVASDSSSQKESAVTEETKTSAEEDVTISFFSNLTDRNNGQGLIEQQLLDMYMEEHPNVHIEVETLDDSSFKTKFKAYVTSNEVPDISNLWVAPYWIDPLMDANVFEPIDQSVIDKYNFASGSLDMATRDGKTYALGRNTDVMIFYYNKELFEQYDVAVPTTFDELLEAGKTFKDAGIIPVAMAGADGWTDSHWVTAIIGQLIGSKTSDSLSKAITSGDFSAPYWTEACDLAVKGAQELFDYGFETCDYATSQNLFINGQAAMWWMGSWEMSLETDFELGAFAMPIVSEDNDSALFAFPGAGYAVSANSAHKDVAMDILLFMFEPEHWSKMCWQSGICMSAQDFYEYQTGKETDVQKDILNELSNASSWTGLNYKDYDPQMEPYCNDGALAMLAGITTPQEYIAYLTDAAAKR